MLLSALLFVALCGDLAVGQMCEANEVRRDCGKNFIVNKFAGDFPGHLYFLYLTMLPW